MFAFCKSEKKEEKSLFYSLAPSSLVLLAFFQFLFDFLTMPTNNRLSLNDMGAILAFRGQGYSLCEIGCKLDIEGRAEKIARKNWMSITLEYPNSLYTSQLKLGDRSDFY